jgi:putative ABC transport system permease protein
MKLIGKEYLIIAFASFVVCAPFTYYLLQKWLENFAYRIEIPIWPFVLALTFLLTLVLIIIGICVKYAMKVSPVKYLKYE